ncbi:hypothetical protein [Escherichia phage pEC-M719-6WT.1]|uniref:Uncharacterized protein n=1 Tax=Escherichia phage pEC-M719-6WT.1 TaxID=3056220 RepID=A0AA51YCV3_9CAUD|nr:hypothetical protein [Escherichia phage pEC-M719-6WT.1]
MKNLKLGLVPTNLQKTVYSNLNLFLSKRKGEGSIPSHVTACWCNGSTLDNNGLVILFAVTYGANISSHECR